MRNFQVQIDLARGVPVSASGFEPGTERVAGRLLSVRKVYRFPGRTFYVWGRFLEPAGVGALAERLAALGLDDPGPGLRGLDGDFVVVALDEERRKAFVFADRNGLCRAYVHHRDGVLTVTRSLQGMVRTLGGARLDSWGVYQLLALGWLLDPYSVVTGVSVLQIGEILAFTADSRSAASYYRPVQPDADYYRTAAECVAGLDEALAAACEKALASGRRPCLLLSGGIDSAVLLVYLTRLLPGEVHTLTMGIEGGRGAEFDEARVTAASLGSRHAELLLPRSRFVESYIEALAESDTPYYGAAVFHAARRHLEAAAESESWVVLTGDDTRLHTPPTDGVRAVGRWINRLFAHPRLAADLKTGRYWPDYFLKRLLPRASYREYVLKVYLGHRTPVVEGAVADEHLARMYAELPAFTGRESRDEFFKQRIAFGYRGQYTDVLNCIVSATEGPGIDVHIPFFEHGCVTACNRIPYRIGARPVYAPDSGRRFVPFVDKYVLRELVKGALPREALMRRKGAIEEMQDFWGEPGVRGLTLAVLQRWGDELVEALDGIVRESLAALIGRALRPGFTTDDPHTVHCLFTAVYLCLLHRLCQDPAFNVKDALREMAAAAEPALVPA